MTDAVERACIEIPSRLNLNFLSIINTLSGEPHEQTSLATQHYCFLFYFFLVNLRTFKILLLAKRLSLEDVRLAYFAGHMV